MEALFILTPDYNEVLLLQKKPGSFLAGQRTGIGGKMDPEDNKDMTQTVLRELSEESSITPDMLHSLTYRGNITCNDHQKQSEQKTIHYHMYAFTALCNNKNQIPLESDDGLLQRISKKQLHTLQLTDFTKMICEKIMDPAFPVFTGSYFKGETNCTMVFR